MPTYSLRWKWTEASFWSRVFLHRSSYLSFAFAGLLKDWKTFGCPMMLAGFAVLCHWPPGRQCWACDPKHWALRWRKSLAGGDGGSGASHCSGGSCDPDHEVLQGAEDDDFFHFEQLAVRGVDFLLFVCPVLYAPCLLDLQAIDSAWGWARQQLFY